jgi:hypothetical protein
VKIRGRISTKGNDAIVKISAEAFDCLQEVRKTGERLWKHFRSEWAWKDSSRKAKSKIERRLCEKTTVDGIPSYHILILMLQQKAEIGHLV